MMKRFFPIAFFALLLSSCTVRSGWPEHRVDVYLSSSGLDGVDGELWLVIDSIELVRCPESPAATIHQAFSSTFSIAEAMAHGPTTPTRQGTPHVVPLADTGSRDTLLASFEPPPGRYCKLVFTIGPADDDAYNLDESNHFMVSNSLGFRDATGQITALSHLRSDHTFTLAPESWQMGTQQDLHLEVFAHIDLQPMALSLAETQEEPALASDLGRTLLLDLHDAWSLDTP